MEKKTPTISCIIPVFNQAQYLSHCIESILIQSVKPMEIICTDDGSQDNSLSLARAYEDMGVKVISQVNKGLSSARNTGIMNATGEYILPLDADDMLTERAIERIEEVAKETNADVISPSFKCFGLGNQQVILMPDPQIKDFKTANRVGYCSAIKREALLEVGGYSPRMTFGWEDYHLWFDLLSRGKNIVTIPEVLWLYRVKEYSMIHEANKHAEELLSQIARDFPSIFNFVPNLKTPLPE